MVWSAKVVSNVIAEVRIGFESRTKAGNWVNLVSFIFSVFLILSFVVLPVKSTHRHYLSVCVTLGVIFMEVRLICCGGCGLGLTSAFVAGLHCAFDF